MIIDDKIIIFVLVVGTASSLLSIISVVLTKRARDKVVDYSVTNKNNLVVMSSDLIDYAHKRFSEESVSIDYRMTSEQRMIIEELEDIGSVDQRKDKSSSL